MTFRPATPDDTTALTAFLHRHEAGSLFPLCNLAGTGLPTEFWITGQPQIDGALGLTETGMLMPQWPGNSFAPARAVMKSRQITGLIGPADQVAALRAALGLQNAPHRHDATEPGYVLPLTDLRLPDCAGFDLRELTENDLPELTPWRAAYERELFNTPPEQAADLAASQLARWAADHSHRVLWHQGQRVAMSGFNARLPDVVQIGGVYVPPDRRGQGLARRVVGLHLAEARAQGVARARLFAASAPAERAYRALGFQRDGDIGLVLFTAPQEIT